MITLATRLKNVAFLVIAVLVLAFLGIRYADLGRFVGVSDYYTVTVQLPRTGGLFTHSDVTYRGVSVGRVGPIGLTPDGVEAELRIKKSAPDIPDDAEAVVASLSAVGEQYIDLRPARGDGPYLEDGSRIEASRTAVPRPVTDVLKSVDDLTTSVPLDDLRTVVDEFGKAFEGRGADLQVLMDNGTDFVKAADRALPSTTALMNDGAVVLRTQAEEGKAIRDFASGAKDLAATLKGSDADLRRLVMAAPEAATQVSGLLRDMDPDLSVVLANLLTTSEVAVTRQRGTEELLVQLPRAVAAGATAVDGKKVNFGMTVTFFKPLPCTEGYDDTRYRLGTDTGPAPALNSGAHCTEPASSGVGVRGSAHAPRGGAVPEPARPGALDLPSLEESGASGSSGDMAGLLGLDRDGGRLVRRVLAGVGLAAAVALCGAGTWSYAQARTDDDLAYARARDAALDDGRAAVATLSTLDASSAARAKSGIGTWKSVTSGPLHTELGKLSPAAGASSRGIVTDAAVTALDDHAGTAKLIATLRVETTPKGAKSPTTDRKRLEATLDRAEDGTWKVRALNAIPVTGVTK